MKRILILSTIGILSLSLLVGTISSKTQVKLPLRFDHYYTYEMMAEALKALHQAYPQLTKLEVAGKSEEGRSIYALTINNPKTGPELSKPGIYVDGNIHGNEIQAGEVCLYLAHYLLTNYQKNKEITKLVDKKCFYIVPVVNPDGRYHFFTDPNNPHSNRSLRIPKDDDRDGLVDEDFPDDLDGDGNICLMRKQDTFGRYKTDPEDPRLMVRIKPGEKGEWTILGEEGIDNDGDGKINEDAEGYVDPNRNWGFDWAPEYVQSGAGDFPFSSVGMKSLAAYIWKRPNICVNWAFHNYGGMYLRGPSTKHQPEYPPADIAVYDYLGKQAERIVPGYRYLVSWKDLYPTYGDAVEWLVRCLGSYGFVGELYMPSQEKFESIKEAKKHISEEELENNIDFERERIKFNDYLTQGELYKPWKPFKHPTYGEIEIGGWVKMSTRLPAPFLLEDLVHRNASAVIFSAKNTPEISLEVYEVKKVGNNLYRIRTRLTNSKAMPTMSYHAQRVKLYPQDTLLVTGQKAKVIAGGRLKDRYRDQVTYKKFRPETQFLFVPGR